MPHLIKGNTAQQPFGKNVYLRATDPPNFESYTVAHLTVPTVTVDNQPRKILQPGTVMAKITSGADSGKVGPFNAAATDGRQTLTNIVGLNDTFLPWQLFDRDEQIAVAYDDCVAVQAWCIEYTNDTTPIPLSNTTAAAMTGQKRGSIHFV